MKEFVIKGKYVPSKKNSKQIYVRKNKAGKYLPVVTCSSQYQKWNEEAKVQLMMQKKGFFTSCCNVVITFYQGDKLKRDSDNGVSSVFDTLVEAGIIEDDNWFCIPNHFVFNKYDKENPRCVIQIYDPEEPIQFENGSIIFPKREV